MAKRSAGVGRRQNTKKYPTPAVQGPRSYISFYKPTWEEIRQAVDDIREKTKKYIDVTAEQPIRRTKAQTMADEATEVESSLSEMLWDLACEKFHEWNWADEEGEPLPNLPDLEMGELLGDEVRDIFRAVQKLYMMDEEEEGN